MYEPKRRDGWIAPTLLMAGIFAVATPFASAAGHADVIRYNRDIRPILSAACFRCHGVDEDAREADLRLDDRDSALADRDGATAISPGNLSTSEAYRRIVSDDESTRMPPADETRQLSKSEVELLGRWIEQGARYERHWAFLSPSRPALPQVKQSNWPRNAIDHFVLADLENKGWRPSVEADKATLIRRVTLDLTGLPPTLKEIDDFLADRSPQAYRRVVNRLLESESYGEHMTRYWLDAARYADTNGFFTDDERSMWRWRNWVINAFNDDMPFDQFTIEQLAGDLLPKASIDQRIASGFNRNHMTTHETGVIDEEYRVEYVVDRLETTATTWLGLTVGCARCHDHKYDPISQKDYYRLFAYFNNGPIKGNAGAGNAAPVLHVPSVDREQQLSRLNEAMLRADSELARIEADPEVGQAKWEQDLLAGLPQSPTRGLVATKPKAASQEVALQERDRESKQDRSPSSRQGLLGQADYFDGDATMPLDCEYDFRRNKPFSLGVWVRSETGGPACILSKNDDVNDLRGVDVMLRKGKILVHLVHRWSSNAIQVKTRDSIRTGKWQHIGVTYDGSSKAGGVVVYVDGRRQEVEIGHNSLSAEIQITQPLRLGRRSTSAAFRGMIERLRVFDRSLFSEEMERLANADLVRATVKIPEEKRSTFERTLMRRQFLTHGASRRLQQAVAKAAEAKRAWNQLRGAKSTTMVMQEKIPQRETFVLVRGQYDQQGEKVAPGVPASMTPSGKTQPSDRLELARWLVSENNPLTARVTVNRFWRKYFGTGLVKTVEDFGTQGEWPSHPDLIDWLAVEFVSSGWDVKHIQRLIVTSAVYRQSSKTTRATSAYREVDPENRLFSRGPRYRLDAETLRDNALAISGLLVRRLGGPSVKPYQPEGLWKAVSYDGNLEYPQDHGDSLFRRSLYTYWKRQSPPPSMLVFDAPTRETCTVRRPRTNTPLQALALMNDTTYIEAARALAQRLLTEPDKSATNSARLQYAFRLATARLAKPDEERILLDMLAKQRDVFRQDQKAAKALLSVGESKRDTSIAPTQHAAWTILSSVILNLDETVSKQ